MTRQRGLTLLEVMVALVVLTLVALGYLQLFQGSHQLVTASRQWSQAVEYAQDAIERAKVGGPGVAPAPAESLSGGFRRQIARRPWQLGLTLMTVTVILPGGGRFDLDRLTRVRPPQPATPRGIAPQPTPDSDPQ